MFYCVSIMMLGYTRINGVVAYDSESKGFEELTPAVARQLIAKNMIKGIKWKNSEGNSGEFICDLEGWNQQNIPIRTACGKFRPMLDDVPGLPINSMYTVVRVIDTDYRGRLYEIVSNKCARLKVVDKNLRELNNITNIAGVWITDDNIRLADGIQYEDRRASASTTETVSAGAEEAKANTVEESDIHEEVTEQSHEEVEVQEEAAEQGHEEVAQSMDEIFGVGSTYDENNKEDGFMKIPEEQSEPEQQSSEEGETQDGTMKALFETNSTEEEAAAGDKEKKTSKRKRK